MNKLKTFWRTFVKSFHPSYYKDILKAKFSFSFKYLTFLLFVVSLVSVIVIAVGLFPLRSEIPGFIEKAKRVVTTAYPEKLVVGVKDHKLITNVKEPYFVDLPDTSKHLISVDTKGKVEDYGKYNAFVLVTENYLVVPQDSNSYESYRVYPLVDYLKDVPNGVILNKEVYQNLASQALPYVEKLPTYFAVGLVILVVLGPILGTVLILVWYMFYLLIFSPILLLVAKIMKKDLSYSQIYRLGMHAITLPILITTFVHFPLLFSLILLVFMIAVFTKFNK